MTQAERITAMETKLKDLERSVDRIEGKLDDLIALKNKGAGAFWLASILFGSSIAALMYYMVPWLKS